MPRVVTGSQEEEASRPLLRVVRGDATAEEVAALVAVLQAAAASVPDVDDAPPREWGSPRRAVRAPLAPGRGGWRASVFPG